MGVEYSLVCKASKVFFDLGKLRAHAQFEAEDMREFLFTHTGPFELVNDTWWDIEGHTEWKSGQSVSQVEAQEPIKSRKPSHGGYSLSRMYGYEY